MPDAGLPADAADAGAADADPPLQFDAAIDGSVAGEDAMRPPAGGDPEGCGCTSAGDRSEAHPFGWLALLVLAGAVKVRA